MSRYNIDRTVRIVDKISQTMRQWVDAGAFSIETLYGIGLLNEPFMRGYENVLFQDFYPKGYGAVRKHFSAEETNVFMDMSSMGVNDFSGLYDDYFGVVIDAHKYQSFEFNHWAEEPDAWSKHKAQACRFSQDISGSPLDVIVGEWSLAITDCQVIEIKKNKK